MQLFAYIWKKIKRAISSFVSLHTSPVSTAGISTAYLLELNAGIQPFLAKLHSISALAPKKKGMQTETLELKW